MGFFKKLFGEKNNPESQETQAAAPQQPEVDPLPSLPVGTSLDAIFPQDNKLLLTGRVAELSDGVLTLDRLPGWLSFETCDIGEPLVIRGYDRRMASFNLTCTVMESTRTLLRVTNLKVVHIPNQRQAFRLPVNTPATLYRQDDERFSKPEQCLLVDISTGGACVESEYVHAEEEVLRVRFKLDEYPTMTFLGQIVRGSEYRDSRYRYGILFAQLKEDELTNLTRTLYNIQTGSRGRWQQGKNGTWGA